MGYTDTMKYYLAIKKEVLIHAATQMRLGNFM